MGEPVLVALDGLETDLKTLLNLREEEVMRRLQRARECLLRVAAVLPLSAATLSAADAVAEKFQLKAFDALMLSFVLNDLAVRQSGGLFLNCNSNDFAKPEIMKELQGHRCQLHGSFRKGVAEIRRLFGE